MVLEGNTKPAWPPIGPFRESQVDSTSLGPDFPSSPGDRERGRFRPSAKPRLTAVAVVGDDGQPIGYALMPDMAEAAIQLQAIRRGMELLLELLAPSDQITSIDLLSEIE